MLFSIFNIIVTKIRQLIDFISQYLSLYFCYTVMFCQKFNYWKYLRNAKPEYFEQQYNLSSYVIICNYRLWFKILILRFLKRLFVEFESSKFQMKGRIMFKITFHDAKYILLYHFTFIFLKNSLTYLCGNLVLHQKNFCCLFYLVCF